MLEEAKESSLKLRYAVGVDVGGSHICSAVVDICSGKIIQTPYTTEINSASDASEILNVLSENIKSTVVNSGVPEVVGVGLAFPGPFDYENGISLIRGVGKYEKIFGMDVSTSLYSKLANSGISDFRFVNDASAFALGESLGGCAKNSGRVVAITLGTGVGSGFVAERKLVESGDEVPAKGWVYHLPFGEGIVDEAFSTRWICKRYEELSGEAVCGAKEVVDRYGEGAASRQLFDEYGSRFSDFLVPVVEKFGADMVVLGGNISRAYNLFSPTLLKGIQEAGCNVPVRTSELLDRAALIGAASLFRE